MLWIPIIASFVAVASAAHRHGRSRSRSPYSPVVFSDEEWTGKLGADRKSHNRLTRDPATEHVIVTSPKHGWESPTQQTPADHRPVFDELDAGYCSDAEYERMDTNGRPIKFRRGNDSLLRTVLQSKAGKDEAVLNSGFKTTNDNITHVIRNPIGKDWNYFTFQGTGSTANRIFIVKSEESFTIRVVDLYCKGDEFEIYANGRLLRETDKASSDQCRRRESNPDKAWDTTGFSRAEVRLNPGDYRITIKAKKSRFGKGTAAIRFDTSHSTSKRQHKALTKGTGFEPTHFGPVDSRPKGSKLHAAVVGKSPSPSLAAFTDPDAICNGSRGFVLTKAYTTAENAALACHKLNLRPVNLHEENLGRIVKTVARCAKPGQAQAWVGAVNDKIQSNTAISVGATPKDTTMISPLLGTRLQTVCYRHDS